MSILDILVKKGVIKESSVAALKKKAAGGSVDDALLELGVSPENILESKGEYYGIPIHPVVNTILKKYDNSLPKVPKNNEFNRIIKLVGEKLPCLHVTFTKQVTYGRERKEFVAMKFMYLQTHTARRAFCSNEYIKGTDPLIIMAISGHKSHKSFMRYIKVSADQFADKLEGIWQERYSQIN